MTSFSNNQLVLFLLYINPTSALISVISSSSTAQIITCIILRNCIIIIIIITLFYVNVIAIKADGVNLS